MTEPPFWRAPEDQGPHEPRPAAAVNQGVAVVGNPSTQDRGVSFITGILSPAGAEIDRNIHRMSLLSAVCHGSSVHCMLQ